MIVSNFSVGIFAIGPQGQGYQYFEQTIEPSDFIDRMRGGLPMNNNCGDDQQRKKDWQ